MTASQPDTTRPLLILPGGTGAAEVARLQDALTDLLPTPQPASSVGSPGPGSGRLAGSAGGAAGAPVPVPSGPVPTSQPALPVGSPGPLLVPAAPGEGTAALAEQVRATLAQVPAEASVILRTSGSTTGRSSLIAVSTAALRASAEATYTRLAGPGQWVLALPAHHVAGLQVLVRSALAGTRPVVVDTTGGFRSGDLADGLEEALARAARAGQEREERAGQDAATGRSAAGSHAPAHGADPAVPGAEENASYGRQPAPVYVSLVPTQLLRALDDPRATAALARTAAVLVGGAVTDPGLHARALAAGIPVVRTYGMSETGGGCVYDGVPLDGVEARIEDPDADGTGRIVLSGPVLAEAVLGAGAGSSHLVRRPDGTRELVTSDRGRLEDGVLTVLGRVDDVIVTGGIKVEPREVEEVLTRLPGVGEACVVGVADDQWGQAVVAVVVPEPGAQPDPEQLRRAARELLDGAHSPKRVVVVDGLPQRGPGKVDRRAVAELATGKSVTCCDTTR